MAERAVIDVGIMALALERSNPARKYCLSIVEAAVRGQFEAIVPYSVVLGTYLVLTRWLIVDRNQASVLLNSLLDSRRIVWVGEISQENCRKAIRYTAEHNVESWDGYLVAVMESEGTRSIYTLNEKDFQKFNWVKAINPIPEETKRELDRYIEKLKMK